MRTGTADLPLHGGRAPAWLFKRMKQLAREVVRVIVFEYGPHEALRRLSDPFWFQAFGCVLGFDWHSSGLTTTVCGALKEGLRGTEKDLQLHVAGGKGRVSRRTPEEIAAHCDEVGLDAAPLVYASRLSAKVDSSAVQDGYSVYHHVFIFTSDGQWAVVQQGMNEETKYARRYHWLSDVLQSFVSDPHLAVCCEKRSESALNLVAGEADANRSKSVEIAHEKPETLARELKQLCSLRLPKRHEILAADISPDHVARIFPKTYERQPQTYEELLGIRGVGGKTLRALALLAEVTFGAKASFRDPARFSFAHGGKDGHPYPVDRKLYDQSIDLLKEAVNSARIGRTEKLHAFKRLARFETGKGIQG